MLKNKGKFLLVLVLIPIILLSFVSCKNTNKKPMEISTEKIADEVIKPVEETKKPVDEAEKLVDKTEKTVDKTKRIVKDTDDEKERIPFKKELTKEEIDEIKKAHGKLGIDDPQRIENWEKDLDRFRFLIHSYYKHFREDELNQEEINFRNTIDMILSEIEDTKKEIDRLTDLEIQIKLQYLMASLEDGHTYSELLYNSGQEEFYPIFLNLYDDGLWIVGVYDEDYTDLLNCKVLKVNNVSMEDILLLMDDFIGYDNIYNLRMKYNRCISFPKILFALGIIEDLNEDVNFTLEDLEGNIKERKINKRINIEERRLSGDESSLWIGKRVEGEKAFYAKNNDKDIWTEYIPEGKILYIRLKSFSQTGDVWEMDPKINPHVDILNIYNDEEVDKIVMDYRGNGGGWTNLDYPWQELIIQLGKELPIYLITNFDTYSAAPNQVLYFKNNANAIVIGEPGSSGLLLRMGPIETVLPNTGFTVTFSTSNYRKEYAYWADKVMANEEIDENNSTIIYPDIYMGIGIEDYINKRDPVLDYLKALED